MVTQVNIFGLCAVTTWPAVAYNGGKILLRLQFFYELLFFPKRF